MINACLFTAASTLPSRMFLFVGCADLAVGGLNLTQKSVAAKDGVLLSQNRHRAAGASA